MRLSVPCLVVVSLCPVLVLCGDCETCVNHTSSSHWFTLDHLCRGACVDARPDPTAAIRWSGGYLPNCSGYRGCAVSTDLSEFVGSFEGAGVQWSEEVGGVESGVYLVCDRERCGIKYTNPNVFAPTPWHGSWFAWLGNKLDYATFGDPVPFRVRTTVTLREGPSLLSFLMMGTRRSIHNDTSYLAVSVDRAVIAVAPKALMLADTTPIYQLLSARIPQEFTDGRAHEIAFTFWQTRPNQTTVAIDYVQVLKSEANYSSPPLITQDNNCSIGCIASDRGNGRCDLLCNNLACDWDGGDCLRHETHKCVGHEIAGPAPSFLGLGFCSVYGLRTCCQTRGDSALLSLKRDGMMHTLNAVAATGPRCREYLEEMLCAACSPNAALYFELNKTVVLVLCQDYARLLCDACSPVCNSSNVSSFVSSFALGLVSWYPDQTCFNGADPLRARTKSNVHPLVIILGIVVPLVAILLVICTVAVIYVLHLRRNHPRGREQPPSARSQPDLVPQSWVDPTSGSSRFVEGKRVSLCPIYTTDSVQTPQGFA